MPSRLKFPDSVGWVGGSPHADEFSVRPGPRGTRSDFTPRGASPPPSPHNGPAESLGRVRLHASEHANPETQTQTHARTHGPGYRSPCPCDSLNERSHGSWSFSRYTLPLPESPAKSSILPTHIQLVATTAGRTSSHTGNAAPTCPPALDDGSSGRNQWTPPPPT